MRQLEKLLASAKLRLLRKQSRMWDGLTRQHGQHFGYQRRRNCAVVAYVTIATTGRLQEACAAWRGRQDDFTKSEFTKAARPLERAYESTMVRSTHNTHSRRLAVAVVIGIPFSSIVSDS